MSGPSYAVSVRYWAQAASAASRPWVPPSSQPALHDLVAVVFQKYCGDVMAQVRPLFSLSRLRERVGVRASRDRPASPRLLTPRRGKADFADAAGPPIGYR